MMVSFYTHWQEYPRFQLYWRWKEYRQDLDLAVIVWGRWFGVLIDYS